MGGNNDRVMKVAFSMRRVRRIDDVLELCCGRDRISAIAMLGPMDAIIRLRSTQVRVLVKGVACHSRLLRSESTPSWLCR